MLEQKISFVETLRNLQEEYNRTWIKVEMLVEQELKKAEYYQLLLII